MRAKASVLLACFIISMLPAEARAEVKLNASCSKLNDVVSIKKQVFNCRNTTVGPKWKLLFSNRKINSYEKTKLIAYSEIQTALEKDMSKNIELKYWVSKYFPKELEKQYKSQVELTNKLMGSFFTKPEVVNIYLYTEKDSEFLNSYPIFSNSWDLKDRERWFGEWAKGIGRQHNLGLAAFYSEYPSGTWQGHAGLIVHSSATPRSLRRYAIQVMPHEYFHVAQDYYFRTKWEDFLREKGKLNLNGMDVYDSYFPPIFREGSANTISFALASQTPESYLSLYKYFIDEKKQQTEINLFAKLKTVKSTQETLSSMEFRRKNNQAHEASYSMGQLVFEWLIAEYGFDAYRKLIVNQLVGDDFEDNLKESVGLTLPELYAKAAPHLIAAFK